MTSDEEVFSPDNILVYVGSKQRILKTENQIKLLKELQDIYNTTSLTNKGPIKDILSVLIDEDNPSSEAKTSMADGGNIQEPESDKVLIVILSNEGAVSHVIHSSTSVPLNPIHLSSLKLRLPFSRSTKPTAPFPG